MNKIIIYIIDLIGIGTLGVGFRGCIGYFQGVKQYYTLSESDIGMSLGSSILFTFIGFALIFGSIIMWRHEKAIGKV